MKLILCRDSFVFGIQSHFGLCILSHWAYSYRTEGSLRGKDKDHLIGLVKDLILAL